MKKFTNIEVLPIIGKHSILDYYPPKNGPIYPEWETKNAHFRLKYGNTPVDLKPDKPDPKNITVIETPLFWCGPILNHFGHFCAEHASRILHYKEMDGKLCFSVFSDNKQYHNFKTLPPWFKEIISFMGFTENDIYLVAKPIIARELYAVPQSENYQQNQYTSDDYLDLLDKNSPPTSYHEKKKTYYISRAGLEAYTGKIAGEKFLEKCLESIGVIIVRPETLPVKKQLEIYKNAKRIIFAEGSSLHCFQLLGRTNCDVLVIRRRQFHKKPWYLNFLKKRCRTLTVPDLKAHINVGLSNINGYFEEEITKKTSQIVDNYGFCIFPFNFIEKITDWIGAGKQIFSRDEYRRAIKAEYFEFIKKELDK